MRLILHTLQKDMRRLWPAAVISWIMLAALARTDRWRSDSLPSPMEGWLNLLLTMVWVMLVGLAVLEEPMVGESNFWTTRPHRWPELFGAKLVFALITIHLPSLIADVLVLAVRGFSPAEYIGVLAWKQFLFLATVTLPSLAVGSLVSEFKHFVIVVFAVAAVIAVLNNGFQSFPDLRQRVNAVRYGAIRAFLLLGAIAVIWTQYSRRRVLPARIVAVAAAVVAGSISAWLPVMAEYTLKGTDGEAAPQISFHPEREIPANIAARIWSDHPTVALPIAVTANAPNSLYRIPLVDVNVNAPDGSKVQTIVLSSSRPYEKIDLIASTTSTPVDQPRPGDDTFFAPADWLVLRFSRPAWERLKNARVSIHGSAAFDYYSIGAKSDLPVNGSADPRDLRRCTSLVVDDQYSDDMLKVFCESPRDHPAALIRLRHDPSGREWLARLNWSPGFYPGPHDAWLSPLYRSQAYFRLVRNAPPGLPGLPPLNEVSAMRMANTPEKIIGHAVAHFDFDGVNLSSWLVRR